MLKIIDEIFGIPQSRVMPWIMLSDSVIARFRDGESIRSLAWCYGLKKKQVEQIIRSELK